MDVDVYWKESEDVKKHIFMSKQKIYIILSLLFLLYESA